MRTYEDVLRNMGRKEVAQNMLSLGCSIDLIQKATKLSKTAINKLAQSLQSTHSDKTSPKLKPENPA